MAASGVKVSCSGAILSSLLYDQLKSTHEQEGFLIGQVRSHISEHISDSQICNEKMETTITISSFIPCTMLGSFYSGAGSVSADKLKMLLGDNLQHVIGWYRSRNASCESLYLREKLIHQQLAAILTHTGGHFVLGLIANKPSTTGETFTITHKFMMKQRDSFEGVPLEVVNMGDTSTTDFIMQPQNPTMYDSQAVKNVLSSVRTQEPGVEEVEALHEGLLSKLRLLLPQYVQVQEAVSEQLEQVEALRALCHANGIKPDFSPQPYEAESESSDLMEFEEVPASTCSSSSGAGSQRGRGRGKGTVKRKVSVKTSESKKTNNTVSASKTKKDVKSNSDPFGFIENELEQHKVKAASPLKLSKSRSNTPSPSRVVMRSKISPDKKEISPRSKVQSSSEVVKQNNPQRRSLSKESSPVIDSQDSNKSASQDLGNKIKPKASRTLLRTASKDKQSPSRTTRGRSPAVTSSQENKNNKEDWSEKSASGSQEF